MVDTTLELKGVRLSGAVKDRLEPVNGGLPLPDGVYSEDKGIEITNPTTAVLAEELWHRKQLRQLREKGLSDEEYTSQKGLYAAAMEVGIIPRTREVMNRKDDVMELFEFERYCLYGEIFSTHYHRATSEQRKTFRERVKNNPLFDGLAFAIDMTETPLYRSDVWYRMLESDKYGKNHWPKINDMREKWNVKNHTPLPSRIMLLIKSAFRRAA